MRIAYLVLCHRDPDYIARLAAKLVSEDTECAVFIHVDGKSTMLERLTGLIALQSRVFLTPRRIDAYWGGYSIIQASYELLRTSRQHGEFERFVILHGADYPLKPAWQIRQFFEEHRETEFLRALDISLATDRQIAARSRYLIFSDHINLPRRISNRLMRLLGIKVRPAAIAMDDGDWHIYWGCATIAFTSALADVFMNFEDDPRLLRFFRHSFVPDESYFHTIAFNSAFRGKTVERGPVAEFDGINIVDMKGICYFEYPDLVTVFDEGDYDRLLEVKELFIRKVETGRSTGLLDRLDALHAGQAMEG